MRFLKEYLIILVILIIVFFAEYITSKNLNDSIKWMSAGVTSVENKMLEKNEEEAKNEFKDLKKKWKNESEKLALFVEHNELEKVSKDIVIIESNLESGENEKILENIDELQFMLEHIQEKNKLKLKNIF